MTFKTLIENVVEINPCDSFAAIVGITPSMGARSPSLWNAAFDAHGHSCRMIPMDVTVENLTDVLCALETDPRFIGGAVTAPHKETVAQWLGASRLTEESSRIGAVNCLFRKGTQLMGTNTDGEGALGCLESTYGSVSGKNILQLGCGGAGKAVAVYLKGAGASVTVAVRSPSAIAKFAHSANINLTQWNAIHDHLEKTDILVNTTSVGFKGVGQDGASPFSKVDFEMTQPDVFVFDVVYDPDPTVFLSLAQNRGLTTMNGISMNLEQAILGFSYAVEETKGRDVTLRAMEDAKKRLDG